MQGTFKTMNDTRVLETEIKDSKPVAVNIFLGLFGSSFPAFCSRNSKIIVAKL